MINLLSILAAILLLGLLVVVHEFGHFLAARLCGIDVVEFAVGFGPKLLGWKSRKYDTQFSVRLIPMGGFCAFYGEDDAEGNHVDDPRAYAKQPVWKRIITVLMGPGMNFLLAFVILVMFFWIGGAAVYENDPCILSVTEGSPAQLAGIRAGDVVEAVDGVSMLDGQATTLRTAIGSYDGEHPLRMTVRHRDGSVEELALSPAFDEAEGRYLAGVQIGLKIKTTVDANGRETEVREHVPLGEAVRWSWMNCVSAGGAILGALKDLVTTGAGLDQTSGPVGVVSIVSEGVRTGGFEMFINYLVLISVNLGVMNLLPIPGLDGSRFLFMLLEAIRRKPVRPEREAMVHLVGMMFLFAVMIFFTFRDVLNLFR